MPSSSSNQGAQLNASEPVRAAALSVRAPEAAVLSAAAKAFNLQLQRIDKIKQQLQDLQTLGQTHRQQRHERIQPLKDRHQQLTRNMVRLLNDRIPSKRLTPLQRETARDLLCSMAFQLAQAGDAEMAQLFDQHSPQTLEQLKQQEMDALREHLHAATGMPPRDATDDASPDDLLREALEQLLQAEAAEQEAAAQRKARKKARGKPAQAEAELEDASSMLRKLYRQLASLLHPDREPDPEQRLRKTALMSEANAAYERKDWVALMQIQQRALVADPLMATQMSDAQLTALTRLLKQQVASLERERAQLQAQWAHEFGLIWERSVTPASLEQALNDQIEDLTFMLENMEDDLASFESDAELKRWLTRMRHAAKRALKDPDMQDFF